MKEYKKPAVVVSDDMAEGVYTHNSGEKECWTLTVTSDQPNAGGYHTFRVAARHAGDAQHISGETTIALMFNQVVTHAEFEGFTATCDGPAVTLVRTTHGNSYGSSDNYNSLLKVWSDNCEGLAIVRQTIRCQHLTNVQGKFD